TRVWILWPISKLGGFAAGNAGDIVIAARNGAVDLPLGEFNLLLAKRGMLQQVSGNRKHIIEVGFEARPTQECGVACAAGFDFGSARFENVIELIAGLALGSTGSPRLPIDRGHAG